MTVATECPHGMPKPSTCLDCMEEGPVSDPSAKWWKQGLPFLAVYSGSCEPCGWPVVPGQRVQRWDFGTSTHTERTVYFHEGCTP